MNVTTGMQFCGFTVKRVRTVKELHAEFVEMTHDKTGAELCWMNNKVQNKLFSVAFKTLPEDSTGVFHILEHSVFCGSEKYPVKDPFVDLLKSSMNTFLNAMTFSDKTVYPVSSRNERDFLNLTSVYLDAVFTPSLTENPNVFFQEGIHTEINNGIPSYKGVVFNEMKGAVSGVNDRIEQGMNKLLFPDSCYRFHSGGDPAVIPNLTYEQYSKTYRRFYHPSNAYFFLDGDIPVEETLSMINSYLEKYDKNDEEFEILMQSPVSNKGTGYYETNEEENDERKAIFSFGKIIGTWENKTRLIAAKILCDVLADSNESPLTRAVLSSGLADDVEMAVVDGIAQPYIITIVKNINDSNSSKLCELMNHTVKKLIADGIDKKSILASINRMYFNTKQIQEPQGLYRALSSYTSWLYGGDPLLYLLYDDTIRELREMAENGGFEDLLQELIVDENGICTLHMLPSKTLGDEERQAEEERLYKELSLLSDDEKDALNLQNETLLEWQQTPDSPQAVASLPRLPLSCVSDIPELIKTEERLEDGVLVLRHPIQTQGIVYLSMYFPLTDYSISDLTKLSLLPELFGELPTEKYSVTELQNHIKTYIGTLSFEIRAFGKDNQTETCTPYFIVRAGVLEENFSTAKSIIIEMLTKIKFDPIDIIRQIVVQTDDELRRMAIENGHSLGLAAVDAHYTAKAAVNEAVSGYTFLNYLHNFAKHFDSLAEEFVSLMNRMKAETICKAGLTVSVTALGDVKIDDMLAAFPEGRKAPERAVYETSLPMRMGIRIPGQISYAVKGYHLSACGKRTTGSLWVASNIVSLCYLWNVVRVQGGAYGAEFPVGRDGSIMCYSYRDPSPSNSLKVYDSISDFIREFCRCEEDLDGFIISAVAGTDPLCTPEALGVAADEFYFSGVTDADRIETRRQMLSVDKDLLAAWCSAMEKMAEEGAVCVVGNDTALCECDHLTVYEL